MPERIDSNRGRQSARLSRGRTNEPRGSIGVGRQFQLLFTNRGRQRRGSYDDMVLAFDRDLAGVGIECDAFRRTLTREDFRATERAAYGVAAACLDAEATAMRMLGTNPGDSLVAPFARKALLATSSVVAAVFGEALALTSSWAESDPQLPGVRRLRAVLAQLSTRVDVRELDIDARDTRQRVRPPRRQARPRARPDAGAEAGRP